MKNRDFTRLIVSTFLYYQYYRQTLWRKDIRSLLLGGNLPSTKFEVAFRNKVHQTSHLSFNIFKNTTISENHFVWRNSISIFSNKKTGLFVFPKRKPWCFKIFWNSNNTRWITLSEGFWVQKKLNFGTSQSSVYYDLYNNTFQPG